MASSVHRLFTNYAKAVHHPSITLVALGLGVGLGLTRWPFLQQLQPFGEFYIALLQICVLPYLLATIPLSARSALNSGLGARVAVRLVFWLLVTLVVVSLIAVLVSVGLFKLFPIDQDAIGRIGTLFGATADRTDIELALNAQLTVAATKKEEAGLMAIVPTNIFAALTANDSLGVIMFAAIFGIAMVMKERHAGTSIFGILEHIQSVCLMVFEWIHLLTPIGVVALIAPQVANIGPNIYSVLAPFAYTFVVVSTLLIMLGALVVVLVLRLSPTLALAWAGSEDAGFKSKLDKLRGIAAIYPNYIQIVASKESGIKTLTDLKGKRVSVGAAKSGTELNARKLLAAAGITYKDLAKVEYLPFEESVDLMRNRQLDATLQSAGLGVPALRNFANAFSVIVVEVPAAAVAKAGAPYTKGVVPKDTYKGQDADVQTATIPNYLVTRADLPVDLVYNMTKAVFESTAELTAAHSAAAGINLQRALDGMPVPLHPGAQKYYKEKGMVK